MNLDVTLLDQAGADAPRAKALGIKDVLQLHGAEYRKLPARRCDGHPPAA